MKISEISNIKFLRSCEEKKTKMEQQESQLSICQGSCAYLPEASLLAGHNDRQGNGGSRPSLANANTEHFSKLALASCFLQLQSQSQPPGPPYYQGAVQSFRRAKQEEDFSSWDARQRTVFVEGPGRGARGERAEEPRVTFFFNSLDVSLGNMQEERLQYVFFHSSFSVGCIFVVVVFFLRARASAHAPPALTASEDCMLNLLQE